MSDRQTTPIKDSLPDWRKAVDSNDQTLLQRPIGSPNGLIVPGGGAGKWIPFAAFAANWAVFGPPNAAPAYTMDADGFVHLRGLVARNTSTWATGQNIVALPTGYAPLAGHEFFAVASLGTTPGAAIVDVLTDGTVNLFQTPLAWTAGSWVSLSGISFYAGGQ